MLIIALLLTAVAVSGADAQLVYRPGADVITLSRGSAELMHLPDDLTRVAVADSSIANVIVLSPREILVNARAIGSTTLIVWDANDAARMHTVDVTVDVTALQRQFAALFPEEVVQAMALGNVLVLTGTVSGGAVAQRIVELAHGTGATVITNLVCHRPSTSC